MPVSGAFVPIQRAKPVDRLYDECRDHDLVLVPDPPLASALNRRLEEPHFGLFATTPRRLAAGRRETAEDRIAFLEVIDETELDWKEAAFAIGNVIQCWDNTGDLEAVLDYDRFDTPETRAVLDCMRDLDTTSSRLADYRIDDETDVAVVGIEEFTALERSILPDDYDAIDPFTGAPFEGPPFRIFDSPAAIIDAILDSVTAENADRVAIVLDRGSEYSPLVEAALEAADVPFYGGQGLADDPDHRAFIRLLRTAHSGSDVRVGEVRSLLERLGADVAIEHDEKRLHAVGVPEVSWLTEFCDGIDGCTFGDALAAFESEASVKLDAFRDELDRLGLRDETVTESAVGQLDFYVQSYEVPVDRENEGVLLADAKAAATVDRPAVFYLGMDEGWTHSSPRRPWVDRDAEFTRNLQEFQRLLQNGVEQYFLVLDERGGRTVSPCLYFEELLGEGFERFSDLPAIEHARTFQSPGNGFEREPIGVAPESVDSISQSGLNRLVNCPRDYLFGRLVDEPDRDYFAVGNLFHDFAEFAVANPEMIDEECIAETVDLMLEEAGPFFPDDEKPLRRRKYRIGLETIAAFLAEHPPETDDFLTPASGWGTNTVAEHFDASVDSPLTERWFENHAVCAKGKIDLVRAADHLVDYKSGRQKSAYSVVKSTAVDPPDDTPNFQAALYLSHFRTEQPDREIQFTFLHFLSTLDDVIAGDDPAATLEDAMTTVAYHPETFDAYVASRGAYEELLDGYNDCVATFEDLGYPAYREIVSELSFPDTTGREELRDSSFASDFTVQVDAATTDDVDAEKGCDQAIRALNGVRRRAFFAEDLDAFEDFVAECIAEMNDRRAGEERFPVEGPGGEPNYRRVDHRDLLLEGER
jgi:hypothetical protein